MKKFILSIVSASIAVMTYAQIPTDSLVGYWPFNGNANDESGNGHNGTVNGAILSTDRFGNTNSAYRLDGINDFIEMPFSTQFNTGLSSFSVSLWFYKSSSSMVNYTGLINQATKGIHTGWQLCVFNDGLIYQSAKNSSFYVDPITPSISNYLWHHLVFVVDRSNNVISFYLDGILFITENNTNISVNIDNGSNLIFGREREANTNMYYNGSMDDLRFYKKVLAPNEISSLYYEDICKTTLTVTDTLKIDITPTSYNPMTFETTIKVYPNPTKDLLYINCNDYTKVSNYKLKITNSLSQEIWSTTITQSIYSVNMSTFGGTGLYLLEVFDANNHKIDVKKIVLH